MCGDNRLTIRDGFLHPNGYRFARLYQVKIAGQALIRYALFEYKRGRPVRIGTALRDIDAEMWRATSMQ